MRKGFTLIEVLVAASIIAIVGLALLKTHSTNIKLINRMSGQYHVKDEFSLVLLNAQTKWDGSTKTLYDIISSKFTIKDDDTIKWLKKKKISYNQDELSSINLLETDLEDIVSSVDGIDKSDMPDITLLVDKVSMDSSSGSATGYVISLQ